jgi:Fe-S-cluster containining protein
MSNPCLSCRRDCCAAFSIFLTPADVIRIADRLAVPAPDFCDIVVLADEINDYRPYSFALTGPQRYLLRLRRPRGSCLFALRLPGGTRCGIHPFRPAMCRCYPYSAESGPLRPVRQMLCSEPWKLTPELTADFAGSFRELKAAFFQFQAFLDTWHHDLPDLVRRARAAARPGAAAVSKPSPRASPLRTAILAEFWRRLVL